MRFIMEPRIQWEDYRANYIDDDDDLLEDEIDDIGDAEPEDDESDEDTQIQKFMSGVGVPMGVFAMGRPIITPWGAFNEQNKFAPFNFYDLSVAHFGGFSTHTKPNFADIMDNVDGVAIWKAINPYCIVIGKGRLYEWADVKANVKRALIGEATQQADNTQKDLVQKIISENNQNNIVNYTAVVFPTGEKFQTTPLDTDYEDKLKQIESLKTKLALIIIENGVVKC